MATACTASRGGRIYLYTLAANEGARRLYKRCGFAHEGVLRKHAYHNGEFVDRHVQGLLRKEWEDLVQQAPEVWSLEISL